MAVMPSTSAHSTRERVKPPPPNRNNRPSRGTGPKRPSSGALIWLAFRRSIIGSALVSTCISLIVALYLSQHTHLSPSIIATSSFLVLMAIIILFNRGKTEPFRSGTRPSLIRHTWTATITAMCTMGFVGILLTFTHLSLPTIANTSVIFLVAAVIIFDHPFKPKP